MTTPHLQVTVEATGEVLEFNAGTPEQILEAWQRASSYIDACTKVKERLKKVIPEFTDNKGIIDLGAFQFRVTPIQRMNYDKSYMRQVFDEDELDLFLVPDKTAVDKYLKDNLNKLGEGSTLLRNTMIPVGRPYTTIRLEKL